MKVILIEDNIAEAALTKYAFESQASDAELVHCESGEVFYQKVSEIPLGEISYILLDLNMPKTNGFDVLRFRTSKPALRKIPVIILSSSANDDDINTCYELGANAYITKPILLEDFHSIIQAINGFWGQVNVLPSHPTMP